MVNLLEAYTRDARPAFGEGNTPPSRV